MTPVEIYTVEYSVVQHCYHIETLDKTLINNLRAVESSLNNGYLIIGIFKSYEAASAFVAYHRDRHRLSGMQVDSAGCFHYRDKF